MKNALDLLKEFCRYDFIERNCAKAISLLSHDICWFGTSDEEDVRGISEAKKYIKREISILPTPYRLTFSDETYMPNSEISGVALLRLKAENQGVTVSIRITATSKVENDEPKLCSMHFSVTDREQQPGEYFPLTKGEEKIALEKKELILSTISGGMMGGYMRPGFPLYFISKRMLEYLGYSSEKEFSDEIDGLVTNMMHPEDRTMVDSEVERQLNVSDAYTVDYRMKKKNGSYIWVHDIGRKTKSETDEDVIISICYDITQDHFKQAQMDNLVNAMPGGVALYRIVGRNIETLYQSSGFELLVGFTPKEYAEFLGGKGEEAVYKDDKERVKTALFEAACSNKTVSLDFRVYHKNGKYIWINGSYRKTAEENGYPIVQAVFTEMPQIQELMSEVVENSGVCVIVSDYETHELLYLNQATLSVLGKSGADYEGKICHKFLMGSPTPCSFCKQLCLDATPEKRTENYIPKLDRYYTTQGRLINWAGRLAHIEYMTDITELKKTQTTLEEMLNSITCGIYISKVEQGRTSHIEYLNEGLCRLFECSREDLIKNLQKDKLYAIHSDDRERIKAELKHVDADNTAGQCVFRVVMSDGRIKWLRLDIQLVMHSDGTGSAYATYYDITHQQQQEQQLRDVLSNVPGGVCLYRWDGTKILPLIVSERFSALLGEDATSRLEDSNGLIYQNVHPDDRDGLEQAIRNSIANNIPLKHAYRALNGKTNEYFWLFCNATGVKQEDGSMLIYASYTDITDERIMAQKLVASETALDIAASEAGLWFWKYNLENNRVFYGKKVMRDFNVPSVMKNYPQSWFDLNYILPEYHSEFLDAISKLKSGEPQIVFQAQGRVHEGLHWTEFRFINLPKVDGENPMAVCTARLIDFEKALAAKYEMERQKPSLGDTALLFHAVFNLRDGTTKEYGSTVSDVSLSEQYPTMEKAITFVAESAVEEKEKQEILRLNNVPNLFKQFQNGNTSFSTDYKRRLPGEKIRWVRNILRLVEDPETKATLLFEYCYDINKQKMLEEVLRLSAGQDYECVSCVDFKFGTFTAYSGREYETCSKYSNYNEAIQKYADCKISQEEKKSFLLGTLPETVIQNVSASGSYTFMAKSTRSDGAMKVERLRYLPYDVENQLYILTRTDVTDILRAEEIQNQRLQEALDIARQANNAKSSFLSSMSHDMRTPINAIIGMCELAIADEGNTAQVHESLSTIQSSSQLLLALINNILDMNRIESGSMTLNNQDFSLTGELKKVEESYRVLAEQKNQSFRLYTNIIHDNCHDDVARIHSALDNILSNAIKYTPDGGTVTYRVTELSLDNSNICRYRFEIADTGVGMSEETQSHLFESLYRGKEALASKIEGTGLGLSISKAIIDLKGGTISFNSKKGFGTTFVVELPIPLSTNSPKVPSQTQENASQKIDLSNVHILMCEDHPINQKVATRILEKAGASVTAAVDGKIGVETFLNSPSDAFDLILMDIRMPNMDGYEATKAIRESSHPRAKTIPIIAMTANAFSEDVQKSLDAGMNEHLAKPIAPEQLYKVILHYIGR